MRKGTLRLRALSDIARRSRPPFEPEDVLHAALAHAVSLTAAEAGCMRLYASPPDTLTVAAAVNCSEQFLKQYGRITADEEAFHIPADRGEPVLLPGAAAGPALAALAGEGAAEWLILAPLGVEGAAAGLMCLAFSRRPDLTEDDWETLRAMGAMVAAAVVNARALRELERESRTDALTGLGSRRHFEEEFRREIARTRRGGGPLSLAMIDVDDMKRINDTWGHVTGDRVLAEVGALLGEVRAADVVARYGGDEFILLMPDTASSAADAVLDRFRGRLRRLNASGRFPFPIRVSVGLRQMSDVDPERDLVAEADAEMYREKRSKTLAAGAETEGEEAEEEALAMD